MFDLAFIVKAVGWVFVIGPVTAVFAVTVYVLMNVSNEDPMLKGIVTLAFSLALLGAAMLALAYFTPFLTRLT